MGNVIDIFVGHISRTEKFLAPEDITVLAGSEGFSKATDRASAMRFLRECVCDLSGGFTPTDSELESIYRVVSRERERMAAAFSADALWDEVEKYGVEGALFMSTEANYITREERESALDYLRKSRNPIAL